MLTHFCFHNQEVGSTDDPTVAVDTLMDKFPNVFSNLSQKISSRAFAEWLASTHPEERILTDLWDNDSSLSNEVRAMHHLIMVKTFRQDRLVAAAKKFATAILGGSFDYVAEKELDLVNYYSNKYLVIGIYYYYLIVHI